MMHELRREGLELRGPKSSAIEARRCLSNARANLGINLSHAAWRNA
jgi:hypothetical protein